MVLGLLSLLVIGAVCYAFWREGPLTGFAMCINILIAGVLAFNFWEPIADQLGPAFDDTFAKGIEDCVALMLVFLPVLMLLRWLCNAIAPTYLEYPPALYRGGAVVCGLVAGYLLSGFLVCAIQTLPLQREFMGFEPYKAGDSHPMRKFLPGDLVWLAMMNRLSGAALSAGEERFDPRANFELRYARYRRFTLSDKGEEKTIEYRGELIP
ncbi:MAG TPA: CvpA family protein [Gemmataceae bacterium]|nr:CvpA family protein [Gemmataceae bacterium]